MDVLKLIQERQSSKFLYDPERKITKQDIKQILEAARWAPTPHNIQNFEILIVDDKKLIESIVNITHPISNSSRPVNYKNLDAYATSEEELLRKKVGLLVSTYEHYHSIQKTGIKTSPILGIVTYNPDKKPPGSRGDFLNIIGLGCILENMWLMANSLGISFQVLSVFGGRSEQDFKKIFKIPENLKIPFGFRLGYALPTPTKYLRVRREVNNFTHHNQFGSKFF